MLLNLFRKLKFSVRGLTSAYLFKLFHHRGFDVSNALLIFGSTRSGSTWLAEIISSVPGNTQVFEPLNIKYVNQAKKVGIDRNTYLKHDADWPEGKQFFKRILSGKLINPWLASQIPVNRVFSTRRLVVKFVRANLLLRWICENLPVLPPAMVIRHPCAVVSSQLRKGWKPSKKILLSNSYFDEYPEIREDCLNLRKPEELYALAWCLRYHAPLCIPKPYPFILICYEKMVRNGVKEVEKLFNVWEIELTDDITSRLNKPSDTVTQSSQILSGEDPLAGWVKNLTQEQVNNVLSVLQIFGMDFYSEQLEPDYEKLYSFPQR